MNSLYKVANQNVHFQILTYQIARQNNVKEWLHVIGLKEAKS